MEKNNYGIFDRDAIDISSSINYFSEVASDSHKLLTNFQTVKSEPSTENKSIKIFKDDNLSDNVEYIFKNFSTSYNSSFSPNSFPSLQSGTLKPNDSHQHSNDCVTPELYTEPSFSVQSQVSTLNINPGELKKLLKVDVISPGDSFGSSYHSINENLSMDSSHSTQTINSLTTTTQSDFCVICNDLATGKHYGVLACEGCKGFFKRTIRKNLHYNCRERNLCPITEKLRNRCQSCRFKKCLEKGMKVEAVQKERMHKQKACPPEAKSERQVPKFTADDILQNEILFYSIENTECDFLKLVDIQQSELFCSVINKQLFNLVMWAKSVPGFSNIERSDQMILLNRSWVEILISTFSFRSSIESEFGILKMDNTYQLSLSVAGNLGMHNLMIRILRELIFTLKHLQVDQMEIACLKAIILYDTNHANLKNVELIKDFRYCIFDILKKYVTEKYPRQPTRIYKLLLKLPSVRGLTSCFIERMKSILYGSPLAVESVQNSSSPLSQSNDKDDENQSNPDLLYPLFSEMMKQKDYPYLWS